MIASQIVMSIYTCGEGEIFVLLIDTILYRVDFNLLAGLSRDGQFGNRYIYNQMVIYRLMSNNDFDLRTTLVAGLDFKISSSVLHHVNSLTK